MSVQAKMQKIFDNQDKEAFRAAHHPNYMFIREFEMVTPENHVDTIDQLMQNGYDVHKRWTLIHENDYIDEIRWGRRERDRYARITCLLYTSPSPRDRSLSRMPSSA